MAAVAFLHPLSVVGDRASGLGSKTACKITYLGTTHPRVGPSGSADSGLASQPFE